MTFMDIVFVYLENQLLTRTTLCQQIATDVARPQEVYNVTVSRSRLSLFIHIHVFVLWRHYLQTQVINPSIHLCYIYKPSLLFSVVASFLSAWGY